MTFSFPDSSMSDEEYIRRFMSIYNEVMKTRDSRDFVPNPEQMRKFADLVRFFEEVAEEYGDLVDSVDLEPSAETGGVTAYFTVFDLKNDRVQRFCDVLRCCSAVGIDATADGDVCISCTVPHVFMHK